MTTTLISPKTTTVINGQDTAFCEIVNRYEKQYENEKKNGHWCKEQIEERSRDIADLVYRLLTNRIYED